VDDQSAISRILGGIGNDYSIPEFFVRHEQVSCYFLALITSSQKNWRIHNINRSEFGTTNALQCQVLVWGDHTIGHRTAKNGDDYCTALKRNMGRSAHGWCSEWICRIGGGLVHHIVFILPTWSLVLMRGAAVCRAPRRFCIRFSIFFHSPVFSATSGSRGLEAEQKKPRLYISSVQKIDVGVRND